jgi:hypothetical protein
MSIVFGLTLGLAAWITFIYVQHNYGDRPTSRLWFAMMMGLGMFEYGKGLFGLVELGLPAMPMALSAAAATTALVYLAQGAGKRTAENGMIERLVGLRTSEVSEGA